MLDLSQAQSYGPGGGSGKHRQWGGSTGKLHRLRFDPIQKAGADVELDWVRLLKGTDDVSQRLRELQLSEKKIVAVDTRSGNMVWQRGVLEPMPTTLAVSAERVFLQDAGAVICLDADSGDEKWRVPRCAEIEREGWSSPTLVVAEDVVLSADRVVDWEPEGKPKKRMSIGDRLKRRWPPSELLALSADDGQVLWRTQCGEGYHSAVDIFYADGLVWVGEVVGRHSADMTVGRDLRTGAVKRRLDSAGAFTDAHHHRCYRNKATERFLVFGRTGIEFVDVKSGDFMRNHWVRGACQYGILPCNGLLYAPSHSCACYIQSKLNGFFALAGRRPTPPAEGISDVGHGHSPAQSDRLAHLSRQPRPKRGRGSRPVPGDCPRLVHVRRWATDRASHRGWPGVRSR